MRRQLIFAAVLMLLAALLFVWGLVPGILGQGASETLVVGLILDTDIGLHAATIKQGAKLAARELKAELIVGAPAPGEDAAAAQRTLIGRQLAQGISALMLAPAEDSLIEQARLSAQEAGVRLVLLDVGAGQGLPYVGSDHAESGAQAVEALRQRVDGDIQLLILTGPDGDSLCRTRLWGANKAIGEVEGINAATVLVCESTDGADALLRRALQDDLSINALLCMNGALTEAGARTLSALSRAGDVCLVGFDCDQTRVTYLQSGAVRATVLRSPLNIGYLGFFRAHSEGGDVYTPSYVVDQANMLQPPYVKLVFPLVQ